MLGADTPPLVLQEILPVQNYEESMNHISLKKKKTGLDDVQSHLAAQDIFHPIPARKQLYLNCWSPFSTTSYQEGGGVLSSIVAYLYSC